MSQSLVTNFVQTSLYRCECQYKGSGPPIHSNFISCYLVMDSYLGDIRIYVSKNAFNKAKKTLKNGKIIYSRSKPIIHIHISPHMQVCILQII